MWKVLVMETKHCQILGMEYRKWYTMVVSCFKHLGELVTFFGWKHWHYKTVYTEKKTYCKNTDRTGHSSGH